jgi:hypothetical protein
MAYDANLIGKPREIVCFVVKETTRGTLAFPAGNAKFVADFDELYNAQFVADFSATGSDAIYLAGNPEINQQPSYTNSPEIVNSLDVMAQAKDVTPAGTWTIPALVRPSGTQGTAPLHDVLFECLLGSKTTATTAGSYVDYDPAVSKESFSIWWAVGPMCRFAKGCSVNEARISVSNRGYPQITFSGGLMWAGWAGRTQLGGAHAASAVDITVDDAARFSVGARIRNVTKDDDNSGNGYEVTAVNTGTNTLTISPGIADPGGWAVDDEIAWFLPDASPATSYAVEARKTSITIDGVSKTIKSINLSLSSPVMFLEDEITTAGHPVAYVEQQRNLRGDVTLNVRPADVAYFRDRSQTPIPVEVTFGDEDGKRMIVTFPYASLDIPTVNVVEPVEMSLGWTGLGSSGEDSVKIRFN